MLTYKAGHSRRGPDQCIGSQLAACGLLSLRPRRLRVKLEVAT
jgi:hypothetical protein